MGIPEYWIFDYAALGGRRFIDNPKQPTISVYSLVENKYQVIQFRGNDCIQSAVFPELNLTAQQIFDSAKFFHGTWTLGNAIPSGATFGDDFSIPLRQSR